MATAAKKKAAGTAKASQAKKPVPAGKAKKELPTEKAPKAPREKKAKANIPDGTKQDWVTASGGTIEGVYKDQVLYCQYCERRLPQYTTEAQKRVKALERKAKLEARGRLVFRDIADTLRKNAEKAGQKPPTDEEIMAQLLSGPAEGDEEALA